MNEYASTEIVESIFRGFSVTKTALVQELWSGYGEISRFKIIRDETSSSYCILKYITFKEQKAHPRGWQGSISHNRKINSYYKEQLFYQSFANHLPEDCKLPKLLATGVSPDNLWIVMEDLDHAGLTERIIPKFIASDHNLPNNIVAVSTNTNLVDVSGFLTIDDYLQKLVQAIRWLANFHSFFLNTSFDKFENTGTYWHLETRQQEYETMPDSDLKKAAIKLDKLLSQAKFQTLVHGDAKLANFCFKPSPQPFVAAVDFQYVGCSVGIRDLVYFMGSCLDSNGLYEHANTLTDLYFDTLQNSLTNSYSWSQEDISNLTFEWRSLIPIAWADFERFLVGWAGEHVKLNNYSASQTKKALRLLSQDSYSP